MTGRNRSGLDGAVNKELSTIDPPDEAVLAILRSLVPAERYKLFRLLDLLASPARVQRLRDTLRAESVLQKYNSVEQLT